jgi:hypothetical protein
MRHLYVFLAAFVMAIVVYLVTAMVLGRKQANSLPGGALVAGIVLSPILISIPAALIGHLACILVANRLKITDKVD